MDSTLIAGLNASLARLGCPRTFDALPPLPRGIRTLDAPIAVVDDSVRILETFLPLLTSLSNRQVAFFLHRGEPPERVVEELCSGSPAVALIDRYLYGALKGESLVQPLKTISPSILCVGFSSDAGAGRLFARAGADGFVEKLIDDPNSSVADLHRAISPLL